MGGGGRNRVSPVHCAPVHQRSNPGAPWGSSYQPAGGNSGLACVGELETAPCARCSTVCDATKRSVVESCDVTLLSRFEFELHGAPSDERGSALRGRARGSQLPYWPMQALVAEFGSKVWPSPGKYHVTS